MRKTEPLIPCLQQTKTDKAEDAAAAASLVLPDLPVYRDNLRFGTALYKSQDVIHHTVRLVIVGCNGCNPDHNGLMDILFSCFRR